MPNNGSQDKVAWGYFFSHLSTAINKLKINSRWFGTVHLFFNYSQTRRRRKKKSHYGPKQQKKPKANNNFNKDVKTL